MTETRGFSPAWRRDQGAATRWPAVMQFSFFLSSVISWETSRFGHFEAGCQHILAKDRSSVAMGDLSSSDPYERTMKQGSNYETRLPNIKI